MFTPECLSSASKKKKKKHHTNCQSWLASPEPSSRAKMVHRFRGLRSWGWVRVRIRDRIRIMVRVRVMVRGVRLRIRGWIGLGFRGWSESCDIPSMCITVRMRAEAAGRDGGKAGSSISLQQENCIMGNLTPACGSTSCPLRWTRAQLFLSWIPYQRISHCYRIAGLTVGLADVRFSTGMSHFQMICTFDDLSSFVAMI